MRRDTREICKYIKKTFDGKYSHTDLKLSYILMNSDQQVENVAALSSLHNLKYVDFVDSALKETAKDFEREKKCM